MTPLTTDRYDSYCAGLEPGRQVALLPFRPRLAIGRVQLRGARASRSRSSTGRRGSIMLALQKGLRSPFEPPDELHPEKKDEPRSRRRSQEGRRKARAAKPKVEIDLDGLAGAAAGSPGAAGQLLRRWRGGKPALLARP